MHEAPPGLLLALCGAISRQDLDLGMRSDSPPDDELLRTAAERALAYLHQLERGPVYPTDEAVAELNRLPVELPAAPTSGAKVLELLDTVGGPATVATNGGRYFGFVVGSALPTALAAHWLSAAWNQNAARRVISPVSAHLEVTAVQWVREILDLPGESGGAFVTGGSMGNFTALAAARHAVLQHAGWNVEEDGLFGAPAITVIVGEESHATVGKSLSFLGLGRSRVVTVPTDAQGRMRTDRLPSIEGPTIVCTQAGNVNTGSFDPVGEVSEWAHRGHAWVHVDGAFGLWAAASRRFRHLTAGVGAADSWAVDAHKWLNVPYDSGLVYARDPKHLAAAMAGPPVPYLPRSETFDPSDFAPELSRRARGVDAWAALLSLGRTGVERLVEQCCDHAALFADLLRDAGHSVLNEVVLNQVLVSFGDDERTGRVIRAVQADRTCWCGGTRWKGKAAMRISVSSGKTTEADVRRSAQAICDCATGIQ